MQRNNWGKLGFTRRRFVKSAIATAAAIGAPAILARDGVFHATKVQAKCASKYEAKPGQLAPGQPAPNINTGKRGNT